MSKGGEPRATCLTQYRSVTLHLSSCDENMVINTSYFHDYIGNYVDELSIHVTCGDLDLTSEGELKLISLPTPNPSRVNFKCAVNKKELGSRHLPSFT